MRHLLVTNDFPPKLGGIQSYLWELWRRLPPEETTVLTTPYEGDALWDAGQGYRVERTRDRVLIPHPALGRRIDALADEVGAEIVLLDPALPIGFIGPHLRKPFGLVLHGAEITVPGRLPGSKQVLGHVLRRAEFVVAAGGYPLAEAEHAAGTRIDAIHVPPGVDVERFVPLDPAERTAARERLGLPTDTPLVVSVSRLVPRKGMDVLIEAVTRLNRDGHDVHLAIAGGGRDEKRLAGIAEKTGGPVTFLGRVSDADLPDLYGCGDVFAMLCRNRWAGLEREGFGIVFLEAAAAGVPQLAGDSGGAAEAVADGETGFVVRDPTSASEVADHLRAILDDAELRGRFASEGRTRTEVEFSYDVLAARLNDGLEARRQFLT